MPLGPYKSFDDCVEKNKDKRNPRAYCGRIEQMVNKRAGRGRSMKKRKGGK